jgi:hypothetical protein
MLKTNSRFQHFPMILALGAAVLIGFFVAPDYGVSWDEVGIYRYAERMLGAYQFIWRPTDFDSFDPDPLLNLYGPAHFIYVAVVARFLLMLHPLWTPDAAAHFIYFTTFLVGIFFLYLLAQRWISQRAAFGLSLLFLTQPLLWGHAFTNPKDTPFMTFFIISVYFGLRMMDDSNLFKHEEKPYKSKSFPFAYFVSFVFNFFSRREWIMLLVAGIVLGFTTAIRALGPMAGALAILYGLRKSPRQTLIAAPIYFLLAGGIAWLFWPYLWKAPLANFLDSLQIMSKFPNTGATLFMGKLYPADGLPLIYFPAFIVLQLTEPILALILIGVVSDLTGFRRAKVDRIISDSPELRLSQATLKPVRSSAEPLLLFIFWFLLPTTYISLSGSTLYDNARQLIFLLPPLFIFAGVGLDFILARIKNLRWQAALLCLLMLPGVYAIIKLHPYQYIYFNSLAGGVGGAFRKFDLDYSGTALKEAQEYLNAHAELNAQIKILGPRPSARFYARPDLKDRIFSPHDVLDLKDGETYYFVYLTRTNADSNRCPNGETVYSIERDGGVLAYIKKVTPEDKCW